MKKIICVLVFFIPTLLFADDNATVGPGVPRVIQTYDNTYSPETCLSNPNVRVQQVCREIKEAKEQAEKRAEAIQQANGQNPPTATPSSPPMPAWQQALEHKTPEVTTQNTNQNSE